jgi:hypothetical protein
VVISDETVFAWAIAKAAVILISSVGMVVYLAWVGVKKGLLK